MGVAQSGRGAAQEGLPLGVGAVERVLDRAVEGQVDPVLLPQIGQTVPVVVDQRIAVGVHVASLLELSRIASEVRVFPLRDLGARRSPPLEATCERLERLGRRVSIERVDYEFQRGGDEMLRLRRA